MRPADLQACFAGYTALRAELSAWLAQSVRSDGPGLNGGGEDEANYALAWFAHYLVTREPAIAERFRELLAALAGWVDASCFHGYEPETEAHHGTEPFILFLPRYLDLFPRDRTAVRLLLDAAEHVGNWCADVPAWFDDRRGCFRSFHIGSRVVGDDPRFAVELADAPAGLLSLVSDDAVRFYNGAGDAIACRWRPDRWYHDGRFEPCSDCLETPSETAGSPSTLGLPTAFSACRRSCSPVGTGTSATR